MFYAVDVGLENRMRRGALERGKPDAGDELERVGTPGAEGSDAEASLRRADGETRSTRGIVK